MQEGDFDLLFASKIAASPEFAAWVLSQTKFRHRSGKIKVLHEEQLQSRSAKHWWKHWWCKEPITNRESETDIFIVFEDGEDNSRFALHIENKLASGKFTSDQPQSYKLRARHMMFKPRYLNYSDFETVLIAPRSFKTGNEEQCKHFDAYIPHEEIAQFIPQFANS